MTDEERTWFVAAQLDGRLQPAQQDGWSSSCKWKFTTWPHVPDSFMWPWIYIADDDEALRVLRRWLQDMTDEDKALLAAAQLEGRLRLARGIKAKWWLSDVFGYLYDDEEAIKWLKAADVAER